MKKLNKRKTRLLRVMSLGLIAVVFSVYTIVGVNAKYKTEATATSTAQVAKFNIVNTGSNATLSTQPIEFNLYDSSKLSDIVQFSVASESEVSVFYDVIVTVPASEFGDPWLNLEISVKDSSSLPVYAGSLAATSGTYDNANNVYVYTFSNENFKFAPYESGAVSHNVDLIFNVESMYHGNETLLGTISDLTFDINVRAEQID